MKKLFKVFVSVFILGIALSGCGKDGEDEITKENYFEVADTEYALSQGYVTKNRTTASGYAVDLILLSSGFTVTVTQGEYVDVTGVGNGILFSLYSSSPDKLAIGTYQYDEASSENVNTFDEASYVLNYDIEGDSDEIFIDSGTVTVKQNDTEYEITFDCIDELGKRIKGSYKGLLPYYLGS